MAHDVVVFDAYGTLFDINAAARTAAAAPDRAPLAARLAELSRIWREKQIGYSWWRAITGTYTSFWEVTCDALDYALEATGLQGEPALRDDLLALYRTLDAYPEVPDMLRALREAGHKTAILSNGGPEMLQAAIGSARLDGLFDAVLSVDAVGTFKPSDSVYDLVGAEFGTPRASVLFVSSNGWDIAAAAGYGFDTVWVNRAGAPGDRLPFTPARTFSGLAGIPALTGSTP